MNEDKQSQLERFKEAARQLGCDEDEAAFDEKLKVVARQKQSSGRAPGKGGLGGDEQE